MVAVRFWKPEGEHPWKGSWSIYPIGLMVRCGEKAPVVWFIWLVYGRFCLMHWVRHQSRGVGIVTILYYRHCFIVGSIRSPAKCSGICCNSHAKILEEVFTSLVPGISVKGTGNGHAAFLWLPVE